MREFVLACTVLLAGSSAIAADANIERGQRIYGACAACHSLQSNKNMTGPSLSGVWGRKAGGLTSFPRYSPALKSADVVWDDQTLDAWITNPQLVIPGNEMTFPGVRDPQQRVDLLAFLKEATKPGAPPPQTPQMGGMMGGGSAPNLKKLDAEDRVKSVAYCGDTYEIATADGKSRKFWERNLRFKTDSSEDGPASGEPALVGAGMMGDRADVIFSSPEEMARLVYKAC